MHTKQGILLAVVVALAVAVVAVTFFLPLENGDRVSVINDEETSLEGEDSQDVGSSSGPEEEESGEQNFNQPPPDPAPPASGSVAYVGCSVTENAVAGYQKVGGERFLSTKGYGQSYGGGDIALWAKNTSDESRYWGTFQAMVDDNLDIAAVWVQFCTAERTIEDRTLATVSAIIDEVNTRLPGIPVYVSAQPDYIGEEVCRTPGAEGPADMEALADQLVVLGKALRGPVVGPLAKSQTRDGCHANEEGMQLMGAQMVAFFGQ